MSLLLVGVVSVALWQTVHDQSEAAQKAAEQDAQRVAAGLRDRLRTVDALDLVEESDRFDLSEGRIVAPSWLGWIDAPSPATLQADLGLATRTAVRSATTADELQQLADDESTPPGAEIVLNLLTAWAAWRDGDVERARSLLSEVSAAEPRPDSAAILCSISLLSASLDRSSIPDGLLERAAVIVHPTRMEGFLSRLDELGVDTEPLIARREEADRSRTKLRRIDRHLQRTGDALPPASAFDDGLLLVPSADRGAFVPGGPRLETPLKALLPRYETRKPTGGPTDGPAAIIPGLVGVDTTPTASAGALATLLDRSGLFVVAAALAMACVVGTLFARRAWMREREAQQVRSEFLTTVTHELKTPLAGVRLVSEMLVDDHVEDPQERRAWLGRLQGEAVRLGALIENVLDLRRIERGERQLATRDDTLEILTGEVAAWLRPLLERDGIELIAEVGTAETTVHVDPDAFRQALINVLDNARKYAANGGKVELRLNPGERTVSVRDHGPGVTTSDQERIFERFRRGTPEQHGSIPGAGLGLHLSRTMLRAMGGDLHHQKPTDGTGACFVLTVAEGKSDA